MHASYVTSRRPDVPMVVFLIFEHWAASSFPVSTRNEFSNFSLPTHWGCWIAHFWSGFEAGSRCFDFSRLVTIRNVRHFRLLTESVWQSMVRKLIWQVFYVFFVRRDVFRIRQFSCRCLHSRWKEFADVIAIILGSLLEFHVSVIVTILFAYLCYCCWFIVPLKLQWSSFSRLSAFFCCYAWFAHI